jgi:hypothetical protein
MTYTFRQGRVCSCGCVGQEHDVAPPPRYAHVGASSELGHDPVHAAHRCAARHARRKCGCATERCGVGKDDFVHRHVGEHVLGHVGEVVGAGKQSGIRARRALPAATKRVRAVSHKHQGARRGSGSRRTRKLCPNAAPASAAYGALIVSPSPGTRLTAGAAPADLAKAIAA